MEGSSDPLAAVVGAITNLATNVNQTGLTVLTNILPVVGTLTAGIIIANIGRRIVIRFSK